MGGHIPGARSRRCEDGCLYSNLDASVLFIRAASWPLSLVSNTSQFLAPQQVASLSGTLKNIYCARVAVDLNAVFEMSFGTPPHGRYLSISLPVLSPPSKL